MEKDTGSKTQTSGTGGDLDLDAPQLHVIQGGMATRTASKKSKSEQELDIEEGQMHHEKEMQRLRSAEAVLEREEAQKVREHEKLRWLHEKLRWLHEKEMAAIK